MIDKSKQYKTRDGREVRIYATDGGGIKCVHGAYYDERTGNWIAFCWIEDGKVDTYSAFCDPFDLIEVRPRHKRVVWVNVYPDKNGDYSQVRSIADSLATEARIACLRVELDFEEGEGL